MNVTLIPGEVCQHGYVAQSCPFCGCQREIDSLRDQLDASRVYVASWQALDGIMVDAGMPAKALPADAQDWLRTRLRERDEALALLREITATWQVRSVLSEDQRARLDALLKETP